MNSTFTVHSLEKKKKFSWNANAFGKRKTRFPNALLNSHSYLIGVFLNPPSKANIEEIKRGEFLLFGADICEAIWRARNQVVFEGKETNPIELYQKVDETMVEHKMSMANHSGF